MKKRFLTFIGLSLLLFSCEEDKVYYNGADFVIFDQLQSNTLNVSEDQGSYNLSVKLSNPQSTDVLVNVTVTNGTAVLGQHFNMPSSITIPAGQSSVNIPITLIDDEVNNVTRRFEVKLASSSIEGLAIGIGDEGSYLKNVLIVNDDCPTQFGYWFGDLSIEDVGYGSTPGTGSANAAGDCDKLRVDNNLPGIGSPTNTIYEIIFTPDPEVPDGSFGTVVINQTVARTGLSNNTITAVYSASGVYDTTTGEIILDYSLDAKSNATGAILGNYYTGTNIIRLP